MKRWLALPVVLAVGLAACGGDDDGDADDVDADVIEFTNRERLITIEDAVRVWAAAESSEVAHAASEAAANLVTGSGGPDYGDRDDNGVVDGATDFGLLPSLDGDPPGLAESMDDNSCVVADVLGGTWDDPRARWAELDGAVAAWTPDDNTMTDLASHPMRIVGWAMLSLATDDLDESRSLAERARVNLDVSFDALACASG